MKSAAAFQQALELHRAGHASEAEAIYRDILKQEPAHFGALQHLGAVCAGRGAKEEAEGLFAKASALRPDDPVIRFQHAGILTELGRMAEALAAYDAAIAQRSDIAPFHLGRGSVLHALERYQEALESYDRALALRPKDVLAKANRASALQALGRTQDALAAYDEVLARDPRDGASRIARGLILLQQGLPEKACADFEQATLLAPDNIDAFLNFGTALTVCNDYALAVKAYSVAITHDPDCAEAYAYRGGARCILRQLDEALADCDRAIALKPELAAAYYNRANTLFEMGRLEEAHADCDKALALAPVLTDAAGSQFIIAANACDWSRRKEAAEDLARRCREGQSVHPFILLYAVDDPALHLKAAQQLAGPQKRPPPSLRAHERLRVAYLSPDFRDHAVAHQIVEVLEQHDHTRFETYGVCLSSAEDGPLRQRLRQAFDHFLEAGALSDPEVAALLAGHEIDIAVDLAVYTAKGRTKVLAHRPAPVAVNYLGYPGTSGAPYIDYIIADDAVIPPGGEAYFSEKIVRLPGSYMPRDTRGAGAVPPPSRSEAGLPENAIVFCAFNSAYKIDPPVFDVWMRLLHALEGSVLWLNALDGRTRQTLRDEAQRRGVAPDRLHFADRLPDRARYLARLSLADMFLDTTSYGAHATANDMLWAGVPVVTVTGRSFATRVAAGMLKVLDLPELIADDLAAYEALALDLARSPARRLALRGTLQAARTTSPLFDMTRYCRQLESAYETMIAQHQAGFCECFSVPGDGA